ncbi:hypothetical protein D3C76_1089990 [compost metagenome]
MNAADHPFDLAGRLLGTVRQCAHLVRHHGKATACFTGTGCLDRRVEGQQVGLVRKATDHIQHFADVTRLFGQVRDQLGSGLHITAHALDGTHGLHHQVTTVASRTAGFTGGF